MRHRCGQGLEGLVDVLRPATRIDPGDGRISLVGAGNHDVGGEGAQQPQACRQRIGIADARDVAGPPCAGIAEDHGVTGEQILTLGAVDEVADAARRMSRRRNDFDTVDVEVAAAQRNVDVGMLANLESLGHGSVQRRIETIGDACKHRTGFVAVRQILVGNAAEFLEAAEVGVGGGRVEQRVACGPQKCVGCQPGKR